MRSVLIQSIYLAPTKDICSQMLPTLAQKREQFSGVDDIYVFCLNRKEMKENGMKNS